LIRIYSPGLGLFLSREILAITGITITETGEPGNGARFEIAVRRMRTGSPVPGKNKPGKIASAGINPEPHHPPAQTAALVRRDSRSSTGVCLPPRK